MTKTKLGVVTNQQDEGVKTAAAEGKCPKCGADLDKESSTPCCPKCGTKPFEKQE